MKRISLASLILALGLTVLSACGGSSAPQPPLYQPTTAVLTLSTTVTGTIPAGTTINSYDITLTLPAGVRLKSTSNPPETDAGVVTVIGPPATAGSVLSAIYTEATGTTGGSVKVQIASGSGFTAGDLCKIECNIDQGAHPRTSDFVMPTLNDATGFDTNTSSTVPGLKGELSLTATAVIK